MIATIEERNDRTFIDLRPETMKEAALLVRLGLRRKKEIDLSVRAEGDDFSARLVAEHHRNASNRISVSRH